MAKQTIGPIRTTGAKSATLERYLSDSPENLVRASQIPNWFTMSPSVGDNVPLAYRPPTTWDEYCEEVEIQRRAFPDQEPSRRVIRALSMYAGVAPEDEALDRFTVHRGLDSSTIFAGVHLGLCGRSARIRAVPPQWQHSASLRTPLVVTADNEAEMVLWFEEPNGKRHLLTRATQLAPVNPTPLAYRTGDIITINPVMICPLSCSFCIRVHFQDDLGLANFNPVEAADYLVRLYGQDIWGDIRLLKLVTGAFTNYEHLRRYIEGFVRAMSQRTNGAFDPTSSERQGIHVLTNLAQSSDELRELQRLGVNSFEHTFEFVDDKRRREGMTSLRRNVSGKGEQTFDELLQVARLAVDVFGEHYGVTLVMGLDDFETTRVGMLRLQDAGVTTATVGIYVPNAYDEIRYQLMTFGEIIEARREAARLFALPDIFANTY